MKSFKKTHVTNNSVFLKKIHSSEWKNCSVKLSGPKNKPKIKLNTSYDLRQKAAHPSIITEEDRGVSAEFESPKREGVDNRINTELVGSQTFHNSRIGDEQLRQLLQ